MSRPPVPLDDDSAKSSFLGWVSWAIGDSGSLSDDKINLLRRASDYFDNSDE